MPSTPPPASTPSIDTNVIVKTAVQATLTGTAPSRAPTLPQPAEGHQPSNNNFMDASNEDLQSFPILQAHIRAWFESPYFAGVANFTKLLPGIKNQISLLCLRLMSGLLPEKVFNIFLCNPI